MTNVSIVIPAYKPNHKLIELIDSLKGIDPLLTIIVVNDGSPIHSNDIFTQVKKYNVLVLNHRNNLGKGAALKTAFKFWKSNFSSSQAGVVTADADGQHSPEDIKLIADKLAAEPKKLHLGTRQFSKCPNIPWKSSVGNKLSKTIFSFLTKQTLNDSQSGLRGLGKELINKMLECHYTGYEYELAMLFIAIHQHIEICQISIKTIYLDNNASTHFRPIVDSIRVYLVFWQYLVKKKRQR